MKSFDEKISEENLNRYPKGIPWALFDHKELTRMLTAVQPTPGCEDWQATAFGVTISSRSGVEREMKDMINFVVEVDRAGLVWLLKEVFYDSKGNVCEITFADEDATVWWYKELEYIADNTLLQHYIFGGGGGYYSHDERYSDYHGEVKTDRNLKNQKYFWLNDPCPYTPAKKVKSTCNDFYMLANSEGNSFGLKKINPNEVDEDKTECFFCREHKDDIKPFWFDLIKTDGEVVMCVLHLCEKCEHEECEKGNLFKNITGSLQFMIDNNCLTI